MSCARLRGIFTSKRASSINPATSATVPSPKHKRRVKPKLLLSSSEDYETPQGLRNIVDNFKKACERRRFRGWNDIYESTVRQLARVEAFPMIEEIIEDQKQYHEITTEGFVVRLISLYGKAGMFENALKLFDEMPTFNCHRTSVSFSTLLKACVDAKRFDAIEDIFRQFPSKYSLQPDVVSYNVVVQAFCQMGSLDLALGMIDKMEAVGLKPNVVTFNTLLGGFYKQRGFDEGENIWGLMKTKGVDGNVVSYRMRLGGMVTDGRLMEAVELVDEMRLNGVQLDVHGFNVLIKGFCRDGKVEEAKYWYDELVRCECEPDRATYMTLVPFLYEKGDFDKVFQLCKAAVSDRLLVDVETFKQVVEGFVSNGMIEEARQLVILARKKKIDVDLPLIGL